VLWEFRIGSKPIYFRNLGWIRDPEGVIVHHLCTSTQGAALVAPGRCAGIVAPVSWRQDLHDLEVGYVGFIINAYAGA
jgi:hypothetical protein